MATGMEFATELVVNATLHGMRITELPTTLAPDLPPLTGKSGARTAGWWRRLGPWP